MLFRSHWQLFCVAAGRKDLLDDPRFTTNRLRVENYGELEPLMVEILSEKTGKEWIQTLEEGGVPCGPISSVEEVANDPQVNAREMILEMDHPTAGKIKVSSNPIKMSETPFNLQSVPPLLGEHTEEVLESLLKYDKDKIAGLKNSKII